MILARETGAQLELTDIEVESVLPAGFAEGKTTQEFMAMLPQLDAEFSQRVANAKAEGKVLRYVDKLKTTVVKSLCWKSMQIIHYIK